MIHIRLRHDNGTEAPLYSRQYGNRVAAALLFDPLSDGELELVGIAHYGAELRMNTADERLIPIQIPADALRSWIEGLCTNSRIASLLLRIRDGYRPKARTEGTVTGTSCVLSALEELQEWSSLAMGNVFAHDIRAEVILAENFYAASSAPGLYEAVLKAGSLQCLASTDANGIQLPQVLIGTEVDMCDALSAALATHIGIHLASRGYVCERIDRVRDLVVAHSGQYAYLK